MCKQFIWLIISVPILWSCDLNHDWKVTKLNTFRDLSSAALHRMLETTLNKIPGKILVLDVKDLYGLKGEINDKGKSVGDTNKTTQEIIDFEERLISGDFLSKKVSFYSSKNNDKSLLYDPCSITEISFKSWF